MDLLKNLMLFLPALFIAAIGYAINTSLPDSELEKYKDKSFMWFFIEFSFIFVFIIILLFELLSTTLIYRNEYFQSRDKYLKIRDKSQHYISKLEKSADLYVNKGEYYKAIEKFQEILIIFPGYNKALDKINSITELLINKKEKKLKRLKNSGISAFNKKNYQLAINYFHDYMEIKPDDKEILKYLNLTIQQTNQKAIRIVKDKYNYKITLDHNDMAMVKYKRRIRSLIDKGKLYFKKSNYSKAKEIFKKVLRIDINNYDALHYLRKVNQKINQIQYFTGKSDKLVKTDLVFINNKYKMNIKEIWKAENNDYIFYKTTFINLKNKKRISRKYGYYDNYKKKYIFINNIIKKSDPFYVENINPMLIWYYKDIIKNPEMFSVYKLAVFYKYFKNYLKNMKLFKRMILVKINFFILIIFLLTNFLFLFFYLRRRVKKIKLSIFDFIFPAASVLLINKIFFSLFYAVKRIIFMGFDLYPQTIVINVIFYILFFILFFVTFQLLKVKSLKNS